MRQLIYSQDSTVNAQGARNTTQSTNGQYWLDSQLLYNNTTVNAAAGTPVTLADQFQFSDSPAIALRSPYVSISKSDAFRTYLVYRPNGADSIWVTAGRLAWSWSGTAVARRGRWVVSAASPPFPANPRGDTAVHELPQWTAVLASAGDATRANGRATMSVSGSPRHIPFTTLQVTP
ncbi:MAG: hypothetical protein JO036_12345 [Candidatus Eremiobacteraeota bacterium]|nr:hypothetical protein [Candidatus Eremiobacteraeota bacterium]